MTLKLSYGLKFYDLYQAEHLVDKAFVNYLKNLDYALHESLINARSNHPDGKDESLLIIALAPIVEDFLTSLFNIEKEVAQLRASHNSLAPLFTCKRLFVQRLVAKNYTIEMIGDIDEVISSLKKHGLDPADELAFAIAVEAWKENEFLLELAKRYAAWALFSPEGIKKHLSGQLFKIPTKLDLYNLLPHLNNDDKCGKHLPISEIKPRDGFSLHEAPISLEYALSNSHYCIICHNQGKDSCSKGMPNFKENALNIKLTGCPLEEKISEMNSLKNQAMPLAALATAIIDNPMIAGTGHRICNDCMKACIYQKQSPVDIPAVESQVLSSVLALPWGFEIYSLLTRWNPLNFRTPLPASITKYKTLVVGMGPAGFTLSHYLLNQGVTVVAVDGLKIEPLPPELSGINHNGQRVEFQPIFDVNSVFEDLATRKAGGFGGVAEYGITVRWNKNYLKIIRLLLERRQHFRMYGGIRFGSNIATSDAFKLGFDHIAMAMGAGRPNIPKIDNIMADGVRTASDFLMTLQLSGAGRYDSVTNLTLQMPVVVLGGGLTAVDAATESIAYYLVQVEKLLRRYESIGGALLDGLSEQELTMIEEQLQHARDLRIGNKIELIRKWGGVKILYRRTLQEAPCYRLNHEEVNRAMAEGIEFIENFIPQAIEIDKSGHCIGVKHKDGVVHARTVLIAIGTSPNTVISREEDGYQLDGEYFQAMTDDGMPFVPERISKPLNNSVIHSINPGISFFGDLHPSYAGNVVKAMASAKRGYPQVVNLLHKAEASNKQSHSSFFDELDKQLLATVKGVTRLTHNIVELVICSPLAAKRFKPGQFYRLQNYEGDAIPMEGLALTGAWIDIQNGLLGLIVLEMGGSSSLCKLLKPDEQVVLMGPTGTPTEIPSKEKIMLVGGGLGNAVLFSIGRAMRDNGCEVLYFAGYKKTVDLFRFDEIQNAADQVVWCCDEGLLPVNRSQDQAFHGNIIEGIKSYGASQQQFNLKDIDRIIVIGSDKMMRALAYARHTSLKDLFSNDHIAIGSINSPMQCMMKEICGQCLQRHVDPITGEEEYVYSCFNQDQELDVVDFDILHQRLSQNSAQEKITKCWLEKRLLL